MSVPMDHNSQDNYDMIMAEAQSPHDHMIDNIPQATEHHTGTALPVGGSPKGPPQQSKPERRESPGEAAMQALRDRVAGRSTVTKGGKK